jgi:quinoprotein glucose dehydrogenase
VDYDPRAAPTLVDIKVAGRRIKAIAQAASRASRTCSSGDRRRCGRSKNGRCRNRACRARRPATQPFPTAAAPRGRLTSDDLIDFTPELRAEALQIVADYTLGLFHAADRRRRNAKACCRCRGAGGANWGGAGRSRTGLLLLQSANIVSPPPW